MTRASRAAVLVAAALLLGATALLAPTAAGGGVGPASQPPPATPLHASIGGSHLVGTRGTVDLYFNATGGPAYAANGSRVGNLTYYASISAVNLTGVSISPSSAGIFNGSAPKAVLSVGTVAEVLTITALFASTNKTANDSTNETFTVTVATPYVLTAVLVDASSSDISAFTVTVTLDGTSVGTANVTSLTPGQKFTLTFDYITYGLSVGEHTFSVSLANQHGLVTFAGGATVFSESFYVTGPAPDYTLYIIVGIVAFFGTVFILVTRVAARRRGTARK